MRRKVLFLAGGLICAAGLLAAPGTVSAQTCYTCDCPDDPDGPGDCVVLGPADITIGCPAQPVKVIQNSRPRPTLYTLEVQARDGAGATVVARRDIEIL